MEQPTPLELRRFLEVVEQLDHFESMQRHIRGYGAFDPAELPVPEVVTTLAWLRELAAAKQ